MAKDLYLTYTGPKIYFVLYLLWNVWIFWWTISYLTSQSL